MTQNSPGLKIGSIAGVPVFIGRSWPVIALIIVALFGPQVERLRPDWGVGAYFLAAAYAVLLLISVLAHEAAHALAGLKCGYTVDRIVADLWGGHTAYGTPDATPGKSAFVAVVGPATNGVLAVAGWFVAQQLPVDSASYLLLMAVMWSNGFVALFNMLPGLPLDGGFLVDAVVWKLTGSRAKGMKAAGWSGRLVAVGVIIWALWPVLTGEGEFSAWSIIWVVFIAMFMWRGASQAVLVGTNQEILGGILAANVIRPAAQASAAAPIADLPETPDPIVLLNEQGLPTSYVPPGAHVKVPLEQRGSVPASALGQLIDGGTVTAPPAGADIMAILPAFEQMPRPNIVAVVSAESVAARQHENTDAPEDVIGLIAWPDVERAVMARQRP